MSDQPHYPYRDCDRAVLGPEVSATADGMTITWQGANYRRDHGEMSGLQYRLASARDAAALHRQGLITTAELYATIYADPTPAPAATEATEPATITDPEYLRQQYRQALARFIDPDDDTMPTLADDGHGFTWVTTDSILDKLMDVPVRHLEQLRQRLQLAGELLATRDAELADYERRVEDLAELNERNTAAVARERDSYRRAWKAEQQRRAEAEATLDRLRALIEEALDQTRP